MTSRRLVIGIDYGTSNSGVAYALFDSTNSDTNNVEIEVIKQWPDRGSVRNAASEKVPSDIAYETNGTVLGCGFEIVGHESSLQWVKLLLEPAYLKQTTPNASRLWRSYEALGSRDLHKKPVDAVADYLDWLWTRVKPEITKAEDEPDLFETADVTVVLTVPASWSERAKQSMEKAAQMAGIPRENIKLLSEPEAAAIWGLKKQVKKGRLGNGDCVIICDAGGGTVDVVAYQLHSPNPLSLDQVTVSQGDFCGSQFVNQEFMNQLQSILGDDFHRLTAETRVKIENEFENEIKRTFNPERSKSFYIHVDSLEDDDDRHIYHGKMRLDDAVVRASFESVMTQIMTLIDGQVDALKTHDLEGKLKGVLLVGGFSASEYLHQRIREEFPDKDDMKIWRVDTTWTAVVRGAVAHEISGSSSNAVVRTRLSGYNFGIPYSQGLMKKVQWLVKKGQPVRAGMSTESYGLRIDDEDWLDTVDVCLIEVTVVRSDEDNASDEFNDRCTLHAKIDCRVPTRIRKGPEANLIRERPKKAWHIPATLELLLDGAIISFRCKINDSNVGVAAVTYLKDTVDESIFNDEGMRRVSQASSVAISMDDDIARKDSATPSDGGETPSSALSTSPTSPALPRPSSRHSASFSRRFSLFTGTRTKQDTKDARKRSKSPKVEFDAGTFVAPGGLPSYRDGKSKNPGGNDTLWPGVA